MKLTDKLETLLACLPESPFKQHLREEIEAIESTVRQDAEQVVRELVEALNRISSIECSVVSHRKGEFHPYGSPCPVVSQIETTLTRAQQWLDLSHPR